MILTCCADPLNWHLATTSVLGFQATSDGKEAKSDQTKIEVYMPRATTGIPPSLLARYYKPYMGRNRKGYNMYYILQDRYVTCSLVSELAWYNRCLSIYLSIDH